MRDLNSRLIISIAAVFFFGHSVSFGQAPFTITFDGPPTQPRGTAYNRTYYYESGVAFTPETDTPGDSFGRCGGGISGFPDNGTTYLQVGSSLEFSFTNGVSFSLESVDLAGYSDVLPEMDIQFVGYKSDGSTVTNSFSGSGLDFQTYNFGPEFTNVTRVEVFGNLWSLDNLVVQPGPPVLSITTFDLLIFSPPDYVFTPIPLLSFTTISNATYALEFSPDLSPGSWTPLPGIDENSEPATNMIGNWGTIQLFDTNAVAVPQRFYRLRVVQ